MKRIYLRNVEMDNKSEFDYRDALVDILRVQPNGMDLVEMEKALGCIGKIKRADKPPSGEEFVDLEEAEHQYVLERVNGNRWRVADTAIVGFIKSVRDAKAPPEPEEVKETAE